MATPPNIIPHPSDDHRFINLSEITGNSWYAVCSSTSIPSQISEFIQRHGPIFLKSTSGWNESHLTALKVTLLEDLPSSRILPDPVMPSDDSIITQWLLENLSASEKGRH
jgi:hypothetical protein